MSLASMLESLIATLFPHGELQRKLAKQPLPDDQTFYREYYAGTGIPEDIPLRVRKILAEQLGNRWLRIRPNNKPADIAYDVDIGEIIFEIEEEFGIKFPMEEFLASDWSLDAIVRCLADSRNALRQGTP